MYKNNNHNKTSPDLIFICVFDKGSLELGLNLLTSIKKQKIENYKAYVTDEETQEYLSEKGFKTCFENTIEKVSTLPKDFETADFNMFSYIRYRIINRLLKEGKSVWYMDADTVVLDDLNDVYKKIMKSSSMLPNIYFQNDLHMMCTGCALYLPNDTTIEFTQNVYDNMNREKNDQNFIVLLFNNKKTSCKYAYLDIMEFPNGLLYFPETDLYTDIPPELLRTKDIFRKNQSKKVRFVHANWMIGNNMKKYAMCNSKIWFLPRKI